MFLPNIFRTFTKKSQLENRRIFEIILEGTQGIDAKERFLQNIAAENLQKLGCL